MRLLSRRGTGTKSQTGASVGSIFGAGSARPGEGKPYPLGPLVERYGSAAIRDVGK